MILHRKFCYLLFAVALAFHLPITALGDGDTRKETLTPTAVEGLIQGLSDSSYRTRRESFLKLCDRSIPLDDWLEAETKSGDKQRAALATSLKRLRRTSGSLSERVAMIQDFETLRALSDSADNKVDVLNRYMAEGRWKGLIELLSLLEPAVRTELLREEGLLQSIIERAWKSENESVVPRLLDLVLMPTERVHANRLWKSMGMPAEWSVSQSLTLPSVKITELEADGQIDEAILLAEKSSLRNLVEPMLIRSNLWDRWLTLDRRRTPISSLQNLEHQRSAILLLLGRLDEANAELDKILEGPEALKPSSGSAVLLLALGRTAELEAYVSEQPELNSFQLMRSIGDIHGAFKHIGLKGVSLDEVATWLKTKAYLKRHVNEPLEDGDRVLKELQLADYADMFFQVGLIEQGKLIDSHLVERMQKTEKSDGATTSAWLPLFRRWLNMNEREKAIFHWKEFLARNSQLGPKSKTGLQYQAESEENGPFELFYLASFPNAAPLMYQYLFSGALDLELERNTERNEENAKVGRRKAIGQTIDQMEELHAGRLPADWDSKRSLVALRSAVYSRAVQLKATEVVLAELASLFDLLGETELAIETLDMGTLHSNANQAKADYLARLGKLDEACNIYIDEFQKDASDLGLLIKCTETLEKVGRISERNRYRLQGLSSFSNYPFLMSVLQNELTIQMAEQLWQRKNVDESVIVLSRQFSELAKTDLSQAIKAANYSRVEVLLRVKHQWSNERIDVDDLLQSFGNAFQSLILEAISNNDRELADKLVRVAFRCKPQDIDVPIVIVPAAERVFGKELADEWFHLFYHPLLKHLEEFPNDSLIGNNTAWLAALCNRNLEQAKMLANKVTASYPEATYLDTLAEIEYRLGNVERAIELSEKCLRMEPKNKQHRKQLKRFRAGNP
ncbi:MAG: hypothetical protein NTY15_04735 [Planctomycetota bacterium]|nr:hypothetical protein [Planctomycetota bacterium]